MKPYIVADVQETRWGKQPYFILSEYETLLEAAQEAAYVEDYDDRNVEVFYRSGTQTLLCDWRQLL